MSLIHIENLSKPFKILNRREGLIEHFGLHSLMSSQSDSWHSTLRNYSSAWKKFVLLYASLQSLVLGSLP